MEKLTTSPLAGWKQIVLSVLSFTLVAFGQPAWVPAFGPLAACVAYAIFWRVLFAWEERKQRFLLSFFWFFAVQLIQLSWMADETYQGKFIYIIYLLFAVALGLQFAFFSLFMCRGNISSVGGALALAGLWVLMEWARLFFYSGFSWNPVGLALSGYVVSMQAASVFGVYGLSFLVFLTNIAALRIWSLSDQMRPIYFFIVLLVTPYLFGWGHIAIHEELMRVEKPGALRVQLMHQERLPHVEGMRGAPSAIHYATRVWMDTLEELSRRERSEVKLLVFPEGFVPYGSYASFYPGEWVREIFKKYFGSSILSVLPEFAVPLAEEKEGRWLVSNAYWAQALSNILNAHIVIGLDAYEDGKAYNAAYHFSPGSREGERYDKRVLIPVGEFIPHEWCKRIAAQYGIIDSFTPGEGSKVVGGGQVPRMGLSICYEETHGNLMRESRLKGAELLVNLSNDVWFPGGALGKQHFDHARLRSVEAGVPLLRACNSGLTAAVDSLGRVQVEGRKGGSLEVEIPVYHYWTLYTYLGDGLIVGLSLLALGLAARLNVLSL